MRLAVPALQSVVIPLSAGCSMDRPEPVQESQPEDDAGVVFHGDDGRILTVADRYASIGISGNEIVRPWNVRSEAESLHRQARQAGRTGDYKKPIALLDRASSLAPAWPYPVHDRAFTSLLMHDADNARKY